jgi:hypothetical protein
MCAPPVLRFLRSSAFQGSGFHFSAILAFLAIFSISVISVYQWLEVPDSGDKVRPLIPATR